MTLCSIQVSNINNKNKIEWLSGLYISNILSIYRLHSCNLDNTAYKDLDAVMTRLPAFTLRIPKAAAEFLIDRLNKLTSTYNRYTIV